MNYISLSYRIDALTHCYHTECSWENQHQIRKKKVCESSDYKYYHQAEETKKNHNSHKSRSVYAQNIFYLIKNIRYYQFFLKLFFDV